MPASVNNWTQSWLKSFLMDFRTSLEIYAILLLLVFDAESASHGGGRRGGSRKQGSRGSSRMQIYIPRNQDGASYYNNANGARIIKSSHFEVDYVLGRKITFFCMAQGIPRPQITWFKDGVEPYAHKCFQSRQTMVHPLAVLGGNMMSFGLSYMTQIKIHEWTVGNDTLKSKMEIDPSTQKDAGYYECQADNQYAVDRRGFRTDYVVFT